MIRCDVIENPNVIETMDLFNDGKDTLNWLKGKNISNQFSELINRLNEKNHQLSNRFQFEKYTSSCQRRTVVVASQSPQFGANQ